MQLTIHRGSHEIGGSCVELRTSEVKILIDLGLPLDFKKRSTAEQAEIYNEAKRWCEGVDALFLSHAHADHYGLLDLLPEGTPVFASEESFAMLSLDAVHHTDPTERLKRHIVGSGQTIPLGQLKITPYTVDHSAFGATAFLFEGEGKQLLYSGDIRLHGVKGSLYNLLPQEVDYLLLEGTNIDRDAATKSEKTIEEEFIRAFDEAPYALHLVWCSSKNIDRLCKLYRACLQRGKELVVDPYTAYALQLASQTNRHIPTVTTATHLRCYFPDPITRKMMSQDAARYIYALEPRLNKVSHSHLNTFGQNYVVVVRPSALRFLQGIAFRPLRLIRSLWEGYWEEEPTARFRGWCEQHCSHITTIHSSGHADRSSLQRLVEHVRPKHLIPIHTESPEKYAELYPDTVVELLADGEAKRL